jgi:hypothetical protein
MSRPTRRRPRGFWLDFGAHLLNLCGPTCALWLVLLAAQGVELGYI